MPALTSAMAQEWRNKSQILDLYRRTRATDLYQEGVDLPLVSRILGHASMETTKIYAKPSMEALREAMAAVAPATEAERPIWKGGPRRRWQGCAALGEPTLSPAVGARQAPHLRVVPSECRGWG